MCFRKVLLLVLLFLLFLPVEVNCQVSVYQTDKLTELLTSISMDIKYIKSNIEEIKNSNKEISEKVLELERRVLRVEDKTNNLEEMVIYVKDRDVWVLGLLTSLVALLIGIEFKKSRNLSKKMSS